MRDRNLVERSLIIACEDQAKVSQLRYYKSGNISKRLLKIERTGEHLARFGEEGQLSLAAFQLQTRRLFANEIGALFRLAFDLLSFFVEVDEDRDFRAQNLGHDRSKNVIDRA